jgi:hypothetical protein
MRRGAIYFILGILILLALIFSYLYIFNIYEITYSVNPSSLYSDNESTVIITADPVNAFGWKIPFRSTYAEFNIKEGKDLIDIISEDNKKGILKLKAKNKNGTVVVRIKSKYSLLPSEIVIHIYPNTVLNTPEQKNIAMSFR